MKTGLNKIKERSLHVVCGKSVKIVLCFVTVPGKLVMKLPAGLCYIQSARWPNKHDKI